MTTLALEAAALRSEVSRQQAIIRELYAEKELLENERDTALHDLEREQRAHELHHGTEQR